MKTVSNANRRIVLSLMFVATLGLTLPSASAMNTPDFDKTLNVVQGQNIELVYTGNAADDPHSVLVTHLSKPGSPNGVQDDPSVFTESCMDTVTGGFPNDKRIVFPGAGDTATFELRNAAGTDAIEIRGIDAGETITIPFGASDTVLVTVSSTVDVNGVTVTDTTFTAKWVQITPGVIGSASATVDAIGAWTWSSCGYDTTSATPDNSDLAWNHNESLLVSEPIGGEILAINSAALLIAGLTTSAIWIVPAVGAVAGTAVTLYKLRQKQ